MIVSLIGWSLRNRPDVLVMAALLLVLGGYTMLKMPVGRGDKAQVRTGRAGRIAHRLLSSPKNERAPVQQCRLVTGLSRDMSRL